MCTNSNFPFENERVSSGSSKRFKMTSTMRHLHLLYSVVEWTNLVLRNLAAAQARREKSVARETGPRSCHFHTLRTLRAPP
jgi:hypothetical protein